MLLIEKIGHKPAVYALVALTAAAGSVALIQSLSKKSRKKFYAKKINERRRRREKIFNELESSLSNVSDEESKTICDLPLHELCRMLQKREITAIQALKAYQKQMLKAQSQTNCVAEVVLEAEQIARDLDLAPEPIGPLHGVPISLKESIHLKNYDVTIGCAKFLDYPREDSDLVKALMSMGAVPFVKTNVPQLLLSCECTNPVYGNTVNPHNAERSPGGSSGGEGALVALHGSPVGFGSDIGGSVRIPAAHCGLYSLKSTSTRICSGGLSFGVFELSLRTSFGPMCRRMSDLEFICRSLLSTQSVDRTLPPLPFNESLFTTERKLKIGYYTKCLGVTCSVPHERAIHSVINTLGSKHQFVEFDFPHVEEYPVLFMKIITADGGATIQELLAHEEVEPMYQKPHSWLQMPQILRRVLALVSQRFASDLARERPLLSKELLQLAAEVENWRRRVLSAWEEAGIDLILSPAYGSPAPHTYESLQMMGNFMFMSCYNLLDAAVGVFPVTKVIESDIQQSLDTNSYPSVMKGAEGLSIGLQIAAKPYEEELCLNFLRQFEQSK